MELLNISDQAVAALQQVATQQQYQQQPPVPSGLENLRDDDIVDVKTMKAFAQTVQAPRADASQMAQMALGMVRVEPKMAPIFNEYEPEIYRELSQLPHTLWTLDNIRMVANLIAARHLDDLVEKRAQTKMQNMTGLPIRGNGLGSSTAESDGLPTNWQDTLKKKGLSLQLVEGFCASNGWTVKKWFEEEAKMHAMGSV